MTNTVIRLVVLSSPFIVLASDANAVELEVAVNGSTTAAQERSYWGGGVSAGVTWQLREVHLVGPRVRARYLSERGDRTRSGDGAWAADLTLRYRTLAAVNADAAVLLGVSAGAGLFTGCLRGDYCGGAGPIVGGEIALSFPGPADASIELGLDLAAQFGLVNNVGVLLLPTAFIGGRL
jgi:hypothetical protein